MSSNIRTANDMKVRLEQKYLKQKEERDDLCRYLAGWCGVAVARSADPYEVFDDCKETVELCQDTDKLKIVDQINNATLEMRTIQELLRNA